MSFEMSDSKAEMQAAGTQALREIMAFQQSNPDKASAIAAAQTALSKMLLYDAYWPNFSSILLATATFRIALTTAVKAGALVTEIIPEKAVPFWLTFAQLSDQPITPDITSEGKLSTSSSASRDAIGQAYVDLQAVFRAILNQSPLPAPAQASSVTPASASGGISKYWPYAAAAAALLLIFVMR